MVNKLKMMMMVGTLGLSLFSVSCAKKSNTKQGATGSAKVTEAECKTKPGYQWDGASCVVSTVSNNQALCVNAGKLWQNNQCVDNPANTNAVPTAPTTGATAGTPQALTPAVDACTSPTSIAGALSCLNSEYAKVGTSLAAVTSTASVAENLRNDYKVVTKNYNQIVGRNLTDKSNILTRTAACSDVASMRFQRSQMAARLTATTSDVALTGLKNSLPSFANSLTFMRQSLKCSF